MKTIPKLTVYNFSYPTEPDVGKLKMIYYNKETKKYVWIQCRYGKRQTYEQAHKKIMAKREALIEEFKESCENSS